MKLKPQLESVSFRTIIELPINIHVGDIRIKRGFKFELFDGNYFEMIGDYNNSKAEMLDIFGQDRVERLIEIFQTAINSTRSPKYVIVSDNLIHPKGYLTHTCLQEFTQKYNWEGELVQLFQFILNTSPDKFKVVDFNDEELATTKTLSEARRIFKLQYPYMEEKLIDNFIEKNS